MNEPGGRFDSLEAALYDYYRVIGDQTPADSVAWESSVFERRAAKPKAVRTFFSLALVTTIAAVVVGAVAVPRLLPAAGPAASSPAPSAQRDNRVDRVGLTRDGGFWAVRDGYLLTSGDAAEWTATTLPNGVMAGNILAMSVLDDAHAWVAVDPSPSLVASTSPVIYYTSDRATWRSSRAPSQCANARLLLSFVSPSAGFLVCVIDGSTVGSTIVKSNDGGATWFLAGVCDGHATFAVASDSMTLWLIQQPPADGVVAIAASRDQGNSCVPVLLPDLRQIASNATISIPTEPSFSDASHGMIIVSVDVPMHKPEVRYYATSDAGLTWTHTSTSVLFHWSSSAEAAEGPAMIAFSGNDLSVSEDHGTTWYQLRAAGLPSNTALDWVGFVDQRRGAGTVFLAPGVEGLLYSQDGARTWTAADIGRAIVALPANQAADAAAASGAAQRFIDAVAKNPDSALAMLSPYSKAGFKDASQLKARLDAAAGSSPQLGSPAQGDAVSKVVVGSALWGDLNATSDMRRAFAIRVSGGGGKGYLLIVAPDSASGAFHIWIVGLQAG